MDLQEIMNLQIQNLEVSLEEIELSEDEKKTVLSNSIKKSAISLLDTIPGGSALKIFLEWNDNLVSDLKERKKEVLLLSYITQTENHKASLEKLKKLITDPTGNILFNKIIRIVDDNYPDIHLIERLSTVLRYITNSNFQKLFEEHKYVLNQIEMFSPPALALLYDSKNWPIWPTEATVGTTKEDTVMWHWTEDFSKAYCEKKGINKDIDHSKVAVAINELIVNKYANLMVTPPNNIPYITDIGELVFKYIK